MKRLLLATALLLCSGGAPYYADEKPAVEKKTPAPADTPSVTLPGKIQVDAGRLARVPITYDGDDVKWTTPEELDVFREYDPDPKKVVLRLIGYNAGTYHVHAVTCRGGKLSEFATCVVTVGTPGPPPPPPPDDPLVKAFRDAYDLDPDPQKAANTQKLASIYSVAATGTGPGSVNDTTLTSYSALLDAMHKGTLNLGLPANGIPKVRGAVGTYLDVMLGTGTSAGAAKPIDRPLAAKEMARVGAVLKSLKGGK